MIGHPEIRPAFGERNLPVVMAIDGNYIPYLRIVLRSILASTTSRNLDVIVLHNGLDRQRLDAVAEGFSGNPRLSIRFVDVSNAVASIGFSEYRESYHLSVAACFKLLAPELLTGFDRAIYLDIDLVVHRDLGELFDTDLGDAVFAGVSGTEDGFADAVRYTNVNNIGLLNLLVKLSPLGRNAPKVIFPSSRLVYRDGEALLVESGGAMFDSAKLEKLGWKARHRL